MSGDVNTYVSHLDSEPIDIDRDPLDDDLEDYAGMTPIPVKNVGSKIEERGPQFGGMTNFSVPLAGTAVPVQILQRRPTRKQAYVYNLDSTNNVVIAEKPDKLSANPPVGYILPPGKEIKIEAQEGYWAVASSGGDVNSFDTVGGYGTATGPGAGGIIASIPATKLLNGAYIVTGSYYADGTLTAAEEDNFKLVAKGVTISQLIYPQTGGVQQLGPYYVDFFASGPTNITLQAVNAAGVAAVYHGELVATPYPFVPMQNLNANVLLGVRDEAYLAR